MTPEQKLAEAIKAAMQDFEKETKGKHCDVHIEWIDASSIDHVHYFVSSVTVKTTQEARA